MHAKKPTPVIAYRRTSRDKSKDKASFLEQQAVIEALQAQEEVVVLESYSDAHSARNEHEISVRPGFNKAVKRAFELNVAILVARADRFTRTYATYQRYAAQGGVLLVASLGLNAKANKIALAVQLAEEEVEQRRRVCEIGMRDAKAKGKPVGNPKTRRVKYIF